MEIRSVSPKFPQTIYKRNIWKALILASATLCFDTSAFGATALPPYTDTDLVQHGQDPAFKNVIAIRIKAGSWYNCSAAKVGLFYITAAHCFKGATAIEDRNGRRVSEIIIHPFKELNPLSDVAFFKFSEEESSGGYPLYTDDIQTVLMDRLVSVGYGVMAKTSRPFPRQASYAGKVGTDGDFSIVTLGLEDLPHGEEKGRSGITADGDSGGPLLRKRSDGIYEIIGVTKSNALSGRLISKWSIIEPLFAKAATELFGRNEETHTRQDTFIYRTKEAEQYMLEKSGKTWNEVKTELQNKPEVQSALGNLHWMKKDYTRAFPWYLKAADAGDAEAQFTLAHMYSNGQGVAKNDETALKLYTLAAMQDHESAQLNLGVAYYYKGDLSKATEWLTRAAEQGHPRAKSVLEQIAHVEDL